MDTLILIGVLISISLIISIVLYHVLYTVLKNHPKRKDISGILTITGIVFGLLITLYLLMGKPPAGGFEDTTIAWYTMAIYPLIYLLSILVLIVNRKVKHYKPVGFLVLDNIIAGVAFLLTLSFTLVNIILFIHIDEATFVIYNLMIYISTLPVLFIILYALFKQLTKKFTVTLISILITFIALPFVITIVDNFLLNGAIQSVMESEISIFIHFITTILSLFILLMNVAKEKTLLRTIILILSLASLLIPFVYGIFI